MDRQLPVNNVKARLLNDDIVLMLSVRMVETVEIVTICQASGHCSFFIDLQHSSISPSVAARLCMAANLAGITPFVRVPSLDAGLCTQMLDAGALGIIFPDISSVAEAKRAVEMTRFPPLGARSPASRGPATMFGRIGEAEARQHLESETMVLVMLESESAISAAQDIAVVDGVDALFIGMNDLTFSMGVFGQYTDERVRRAVRTAQAAANACGKFLLVGGIRDPDISAKFIDDGAARFFVTGTDSALLLGKAEEQASKYLSRFEDRSADQ